MPGISGTLEERFWKKVNKTESCWLWKGAINAKGYGHLNRGAFGLGVQRAHRTSWEIHNGPIPADKILCHSCDVRHCVNPAHLFLGDNKMNQDDSIQKGRKKRGEDGRFAGVTE